MWRKLLSGPLSLGRGLMIAALLTLATYIVIGLMPENIIHVIGLAIGCAVVFCAAYYFITPVREFIRLEIYKRRGK